MAADDDNKKDQGLNVPSKEETARIEEFLRLIKSGKVDVDEMVARLKALSEELYGTSEAYKQSAETVYQHSRGMKDLTTSVKLHTKLLAEEALRAERKLSLTNELIAQTRVEIEQNADNASKVAELTERLIALNEQFDQQSRALEDVEEKARRYNDITDVTYLTIDALTGVSDKWKGTLIGTVIASGNLSKGLDAVTAQMQKQLTLANAVGSVLMKVQEMTIKMAAADDSAAVSLMRFNNATDEQIDATLHQARSNRALGFSQKEMAESKKVLQQTVVSFTGLTQKESDSLAVLNATLDNFGVSASEGAEMTAYLIDTLNMGVKETVQFTHEMQTFGKNIGKSFQELTKEFNSARQVLLNYGSSGKQVFKELSATAKAFRMNVNQITGAMEDQYNTFEDAYRNVGRLNSLLAQEGVILDANAMMTMNLATRTAYLSEKIKGTELATRALADDAMAKFHLRSIASAAGINDLDFVMKALTGDMGELGKKVDYATDSYQKFMSDDFLKKAKNQQEIFEKFKMAMEQFGMAVMPIVRTVTSALTLFNEAMDYLRQLSPTVFNGLANIVSILLALKLITFAVTLGKSAMAGASALLAAMTGAETAAEATNTAGKWAAVAAMKAKAAAAMATMYHMFAFAGAVALVGVGIGAATIGISMLADSFKELNPEQLSALNGVLIGLGVTLVAFAIGTALIAPKLAVASAGLIPFGAAIALIGFGIGLAAAGMSLLVNSMSGLNLETAAAIGAISLALVGMIAVMGKMALVGVIAGAGLAIVFGALGAFVGYISGENRLAALQSLNGILTKIASLDFGNMKDSIGNVSTAIGDMLEKVGELPDEKVVKIEKVFGAMASPTAATTPAPGPMAIPSRVAGNLSGSPAGTVEAATPQSGQNFEAFSDKVDKLISELTKLQKVGVTLEMGVSSTKKMAATVKQVINSSA